MPKGLGIGCSGGYGKYQWKVESPKSKVRIKEKTGNKFSIIRLRCDCSIHF